MSRSRTSSLSRRLALALGVLLWTAFVAALLLSDASSQGPVFLKFTAEHGVHVGDAVVLLAWVGGMLVALDLMSRNRV